MSTEFDDAVPTVHAEPIPQAEPMGLLNLAVQHRLPVETIERLAALHERMSDRQAAAEFNAAMAAFAGECPSIEKTSMAKIATKVGGEYGYRYADLDQIATTIRPVLQRNGLSYSWDSKLDGSNLTCVCTVRHIGGHSQAATFTCPTDSTSGMSSQQKQASALTFARRQSLIQALGLTTCDPAGERPGERITAEQAAEIEAALVAQKTDRTKFLHYVSADCVENILASKRVMARTALKLK